MEMKRRDFLAGALVMALPGSTLKFRILDPHVHVWANDPRYPWARETTEPPKDNETPSMLLDLMKANGVARTVLEKANFTAV
jgi:predicted TIM-barrel fold metal-dependent hydrolase